MFKQFLIVEIFKIRIKYSRDVELLSGYNFITTIFIKIFQKDLILFCYKLIKWVESVLEKSWKYVKITRVSKSTKIHGRYQFIYVEILNRYRFICRDRDSGGDLRDKHIGKRINCRGT